ncbi:hypothetical protein ACJX0J_031808, partial [Zea mays]
CLFEEMLITDTTIFVNNFFDIMFEVLFQIMLYYYRFYFIMFVTKGKREKYKYMRLANGSHKDKILSTINNGSIWTYFMRRENLQKVRLQRVLEVEDDYATVLLLSKKITTLGIKNILVQNKLQIILPDGVSQITGNNAKERYYNLVHTSTTTLE